MLAGQMDQAYDELVHGQPTSDPVIEEVKAYVKDIQDNRLIVQKEVRPPDTDIDAIRI